MLSENSIVTTIVLILSFGAGMTVTIRLPTSVAMPAHEVTIPRTRFPPFALGRINAGRTASNADATKFTPARNRIRSNIILFSLRYLIPLPAATRTDSFFADQLSASAFRTFSASSDFSLLFTASCTSGISTKNSNAIKATANVARST